SQAATAFAIAASTRHRSASSARTCADNAASDNDPGSTSHTSATRTRPHTCHDQHRGEVLTSYEGGVTLSVEEVALDRDIRGAELREQPRLELPAQLRVGLLVASPRQPKEVEVLPDRGE